jgi:hypothetical protein
MGKGVAMRKFVFAATAALSGALLSSALVGPAAAQVSGTTGNVAKFTSPSSVGNSVMFQSAAGNIGVGTTTPTSKLDINASNALAIHGAAPFINFYDTSKASQRAAIQSIGGGLKLIGDSVFKGTNPSGFVHVDRNGRLGLGTAAPQRQLQIGPSTDAMFTIEPSDQSPYAGYIRFGDGTGWHLFFGRSRECSGCALNTGPTGRIFRIDDNGVIGVSQYPLGFTGIQPLCRTSFNDITLCQSSSLRYKTAIIPYAGGLDVIERLKPIAFTRKYNGAHEVGFGAEDVAAVEPRLTYNNDDGQIEGVHYELLTTVLVNAVKQQQSEIKQEQAEIKRQRALIEDLQARLAKLEQGASAQRSN